MEREAEEERLGESEEEGEEEEGGPLDVSPTVTMLLAKCVPKGRLALSWPRSERQGEEMWTPDWLVVRWPRGWWSHSGTGLMATGKMLEYADDIDGMVLSSSTIPFVGNIHHRFSICKAPASVKKRFRRAIVELMQGTSLPIM